MKRSKFIYRFALAATLFFTIGHLCDKKTKGFTMHKIASNSFIDTDVKEAGVEPDATIEPLLNQPFYFLGRGGQCFAFVGEDGKTVIKFFKQHNIRYWSWLNQQRLPAAVDHFREKILKKHRHRSPLFFESCKIAYEEFKDRTGLIYLHLNNTTDFKQEVTIVDRLGIGHKIDPNTTRFALQKRARPAYKKLKQLMHENDIDGAKKCIDSILNLIVERTEKGIKDRDPNIKRNFGFIGNQAIEIDLGSFTKSHKECSVREEVIEKSQKLKKWIAKRSPPLADYLDEKIDALVPSDGAPAKRVTS